MQSMTIVMVSDVLLRFIICKFLFFLGFCFIEFASESIVDRIVKQKYHTVAGKRVSLLMIFCFVSAFILFGQ